MERIFHVIFTLNGLTSPSDRRILVRTHIHDIVVTLVLNRTAGVELLDGIVGSLEVVTRAGLVTQRPDYDRRMVHMSVYQLHNAGYVSVLEFRNMRKRCVAVVVLMAFQVRLVFQIDTIFVAQIVPVRIARIVRVTHVVDVTALHDHNLLFHLLVSDAVTAVRIDFLTVHTLQFHRLVVYVEITSGQSEFIILGLGVLDFYLAYTEVRRNYIYGLSLFVLQFNNQSIAVRLFG